MALVINKKTRKRLLWSIRKSTERTESICTNLKIIEPNKKSKPNVYTEPKPNMFGLGHFLLQEAVGKTRSQILQIHPTPILSRKIFLSLSPSRPGSTCKFRWVYTKLQTNYANFLTPCYDSIYVWLYVLPITVYPSFLGIFIYHFFSILHPL